MQRKEFYAAARYPKNQSDENSEATRRVPETLCHFTTRTFATRKFVAKHVVADVADNSIATHYFVAQILVANLFSIYGGPVWVFLLITCI
jgi:hypothetical protein